MVDTWHQPAQCSASKGHFLSCDQGSAFHCHPLGQFFVYLRCTRSLLSARRLKDSNPSSDGRCSLVVRLFGRVWCVGCFCFLAREISRRIFCCGKSLRCSIVQGPFDLRGRDPNSHFVFILGPVESADVRTDISSGGFLATWTPRPLWFQGCLAFSAFRCEARSRTLCLYSSSVACSYGSCTI